MSDRDPQFGAGSEAQADPFASSVDDSMAATDEFLKGLDTEKELQDHASETDHSWTGSATAPRETDDVKNKTHEATDTLSNKADDATGKAQEKAEELSDKAHDKADQGMDAAASGLGSAADTLRQQGEQRGGTVGTAAAKTADTLESASKYLRDKDSDQLVKDLESLVREKPVESLLVAAGVGFLLSKLFR